MKIFLLGTLLFIGLAAPVSAKVETPNVESLTQTNVICVYNALLRRKICYP